MGIEQLLQRMQTQVTRVTGLHDCFIKDFSATPAVPMLPEVTESDLLVTPVTPSNRTGSEENINEINDVTSVTPVTPEKNESQPGLQTCAGCHHVSRYGNCTIPERSALAQKFMLISHPRQGDGCTAFEPKLNPFAQESIAMASIALKQDAISEEEYSHANELIHEHADDADYLHEWIQLIAACQERSSRRSER